MIKEDEQFGRGLTLEELLSEPFWLYLSLFLPENSLCVSKTDFASHLVQDHQHHGGSSQVHFAQSTTASTSQASKSSDSSFLDCWASFSVGWKTSLCPIAHNKLDWQHWPQSFLSCLSVVGSLKFSHLISFFILITEF